MALPLSIVTFGANVLVGPATLTEIPEDYYPQYWEYYRNPITRFMARYLFFNPQKDYEKSIHMIYLESQIMEIRKLEQKVWDLQDERKDFRYNLFIPFNYIKKSSYMQGLQDDYDFGD
nr:SGDH subunit [Ceratosolen solmsi]